MKKTLTAILIIALSALILTSCFGPDSKKEEEDKSKKMFTSVVYVDDLDGIISIRSAVTDITGIIPFIKDTEPVSDGEIVFGNTNRPITAAAKTALAEEIKKSSDYDIGYIIYKEGNNLAVYWQDAEMQNIAIAKFLDVCVEEKRLELDDGVIAFVGYDSIEYERDKYWLAISAVADSDVLSSLKALHNYFDGDKMADFFANLWDGSTGGFYYTIGARDNVGFLPDLESTKQILESLVENGAIEDLNVTFPAEIKEKLVAFAKSTQSATDGYFYHPQWPQGKENLQLDRYGRDMGHATTIISMFTIDTDGDGVEEKQYPDYCAPNGIKCATHTGTDDHCFDSTASCYPDRINGSVVATLSSSISSSVSRLTSSVVTPCATDSSHPDYSSATAFSNWLEAYNYGIGVENSGNAHKLSAIRDEITQHGYDQIVLDHLDRVQKELFDRQEAYGEEPTGVWTPNIDYDAVWGFLKYSGWYNASGGKGRAIDEKYVPYIVRTFVKVISLPADGNYRSNDLFNMWDGIRRLISNAKKYYGDELVAEIRGILHENAAALINNSLEKVDDLSIGNGTFAYTSDKKSLATIYGTSISPGISEGNVNSTDIVTSMYRAVFEVFGYTPVPLMSKQDGARFVDTICTLGDIEKNEVIIDTIDFEDGNLPNTFGYNSNDSAFSCEIAEAPDDPSNSVLYISSPGEGGTNLLFSTVGVGSKCYLFESDIYISSETNTNNSSGSAYIAQIKMGDATNSGSTQISYMIALKKNVDSIDIVELTTTGSDAVSNVVKTVDLNKWFKLRIEYYTVEDDSDDVPHAKIWVDESLVYTSSGMYYGVNKDGTEATPYFGYSKVNIWTLKTPSLYMYLDNCFFACENKDFDATDDTITDSRDN